jgi:hypothetical protein
MTTRWERLGRLALAKGELVVKKILVALGLVSATSIPAEALSHGVLLTLTAVQGQKMLWML